MWNSTWKTSKVHRCSWTSVWAFELSCFALFVLSYIEDFAFIFSCWIWKKITVERHLNHPMLVFSAGYSWQIVIDTDFITEVLYLFMIFSWKKIFEWPSISGKNFSFLCPQNSGDNSFSYRTATYGSPCIRNSEGFRIKLTEPYVVSETILDSAQYWWNFHVVLSKENKPFFTLRNLKTLSEKTTKRLSFHETENSSLEKWRTLKVRWKTYFFRVQAPTVDIDGVNISSILDTTMLSLWRWE